MVLGKRAIIILSLLLLSCSKEKVEIYCNKIYAPVCANGTLYANACLAEKAGHKKQRYRASNRGRKYLGL